MVKINFSNGAGKILYSFTSKIFITFSILFFQCQENINTPISNKQLQPPLNPTLISLTVGDRFVIVNWSLSSNATKYNIYYTEDMSFNKINALVKKDVSYPPYKITGLKNSQEYSIAVSAVNGDGESELSNILIAVPERDDYLWLNGFWSCKLTVGSQKLPAHMNLIFNNIDSSFSFSRVIDSTGEISLQASGKYFIIYSTPPNDNTVKLSTVNDTGYYVYNWCSGEDDDEGRWFKWLSGHDFMKAANPSETMWFFD